MSFKLQRYNICANNVVLAHTGRSTIEMKRKPLNEEEKTSVFLNIFNQKRLPNKK